MAAARTGSSGGVINGLLYVVGGYNSSETSVVGTLEVYDPVSNSWTTKAAMPTARAYLSVEVLNGILYAVGGVNNNSVYLNTVEAYDPATNTWTTKATMPTARGFLSAAGLNGILYAIGGWDATKSFATVEAYDPVTNTWTADAPLPTARSGLEAAVMNGHIFAVGGWMGTNAIPTGANEAFTPQVWTGKGSDNNWSNPANWQGTVPTGGDILAFPSGASRLANNNDLPDGTSFSLIKFTGAGYDISGDAITLTSGMNANLTGGGTDKVEDNITLAANTAFTVNAGSTLILSGNLDGSGGLQLNGSGILDLAGTNTYNGATAINQGKLLLAGSLDTNSTVTLASGATLEVSGTLTLEQSASLNDQGTLTVDAGGAVDDLGLLTVATTGTLTDSSSGIAGVAGVQVEQGAELNVQGALTVKAGGTLDDFGSLPVATTGSLVDNSNGITGVAGVQVEQGAILANQGAATVSNGIMVVNGLMTGPLTVDSGGFLEGTGSVGNITAKNGGTVVPGLVGSMGILYAQSVNLSSGGVLYIQIAGYQTPGTDFSRLVTGGLVLGGTSKLTLDLSGLTTRGTIRGIVTDGGQTGTFSTVQLLNNPFGFGDTLIYKNDSIDVTIF
jgi:autotransporter-associated beta strand protein